MLNITCYSLALSLQAFSQKHHYTEVAVDFHSLLFRQNVKQALEEVQLHTKSMKRRD